MPTDAPAGGWGARVLTALLGGVLLFQEAPRVVSAALLQSGEGVKQRILAGQSPSEEELAKALKRVEAAQRWDAAPAGYVLQGRLFDHLAEGRTETLSLRQQARDAYRRSLSLHPAQHRVWHALAVDEGKRGDAHALGEALRLSLATGFYDPEVMYYRLELGLRAWSRLTPGQRSALDVQFRAMWDDGNSMTAQSVRRVGAGPIALGLLAGWPSSQKRLGELLDHFSKYPPTR